MKEIVAKYLAGVWPIPEISMDKHDGVIVCPVRMRSISVFTIHYLKILMSVSFNSHFVNEIGFVTIQLTNIVTQMTISCQMLV